MSERAQVAVLGGGSWGTVLGHLAAVGSGSATLYVRRQETADEINEQHTNKRYLGDHKLHPGLKATTNLEESVSERPLVIFAIPSKAIRGVAAKAGAFIGGEQVLLSATKGLEPKTFVRMSQVLREETCARKVGAITGPNLAKEIAAGQPCATVVASRYREAIALSAELLHSPSFRIYGNMDVKGAELGGALKNCIAIATGIAGGLGLGDNVRSMIMTRGLAEIQRLGVKLGADPHTFAGLAGIGDLMCTCSSKLSRNFRVGFGLAQGKTLEQILEELGEVAEGVNTTRVVLELAKREDVPLPIVEGVGGVLAGTCSVKDVLNDLMTRAARYEIDFEYTAEVELGE